MRGLIVGSTGRILQVSRYQCIQSILSTSSRFVGFQNLVHNYLIVSFDVSRIKYCLIDTLCVPPLRIAVIRLWPVSSLWWTRIQRGGGPSGCRVHTIVVSISLYKASTPPQGLTLTGRRDVVICMPTSRMEQLCRRWRWTLWLETSLCWGLTLSWTWGIASTLPSI